MAVCVRKKTNPRPTHVQISVNRTRGVTYSCLDMTMKKHFWLARSGSENGSVPVST